MTSICGVRLREGCCELETGDIQLARESDKREVFGLMTDWESTAHCEPIQIGSCAGNKTPTKVGALVSINGGAYQSDAAGANMKMTNQEVNARLRFNTLAQSPYPIRLDGMDVVKASFDEIVAESDDGKKIVYKRNEVGLADKPQLNNLKCQFFINGKWI